MLGVDAEEFLEEADKVIVDQLGQVLTVLSKVVCIICLNLLKKLLEV